MKKFVAFARVSSREQQREGFSLDVQEEALMRYAKQQGGDIMKFTKVAETASDETARRHFNETVDFTIKNAAVLDRHLVLQCGPSHQEHRRPVQAGRT